MRDELHNETLFISLDHARIEIAAWAQDHNNERLSSFVSSQTVFGKYPSACVAWLTICRRVRRVAQCVHAAGGTGIALSVGRQRVACRVGKL